MYNAVVQSIARVYHEAGYTTLRFNFRSVGGSAGEYDEGLGEREDVSAALQYLTGEGKTVLELAGYSFGAWVNAHIDLTAAGVQRMIMVSPPVAFLDFSSVAVSPPLNLVIAGSRDQIAPPDLIRTMLPQWNPESRLEVIEGADHFYIGCAEKLEHILADYLGSGLAL
jgi:alpha/beta superfamily hydrolase